MHQENQSKQDNNQLLSIYAVSKELKLGMVKTKNLIKRGLLESVDCGGKIMVPRCKLDEYINGNSGYRTINNAIFEGITEDEVEMQKIFSEFKNQ